MILDFQTEENQLRKRIVERQHNKTDASEATLDVLDFQIDIREPLKSVEIKHRVIVDTSAKINLQDIIKQIKLNI